MELTDAAITLPCQDPKKGAMFWAHVLGLQRRSHAGAKSVAVLATVPQYFLRAGSETRVGNRVRLDLVPTISMPTPPAFVNSGRPRCVATVGTHVESITFLDLEEEPAQ